MKIFVYFPLGFSVARFKKWVIKARQKRPRGLNDQSQFSVFFPELFRVGPLKAAAAGKGDANFPGKKNQGLAKSSNNWKTIHVLAYFLHE